MREVLITAPELAERLGVPGTRSNARMKSRTIVIDVTWRLMSPDGHNRFLASHIPGAVHADLEDDLSGAPSASEGRMPLPSEQLLTERLRSWGVSAGDAIVVTDDVANRAAARGWWLLRHAGLGDVRLLDGGLAAWRKAGLPFEAGPVQASRGDATALFGSMPTIDMKQAAQLPQHGVLLDARERQRYTGEHEQLDPRGGHIPGARSAPAGANLDEDGWFISPGGLRQRFTTLGVTGDVPVGVYCGAGNAGAVEVAALAIAGIDAALYCGSWSQWSNHTDMPVVVGEDAATPEAASLSAPDHRRPRQQRPAR